MDSRAGRKPRYKAANVNLSPERAGRSASSVINRCRAVSPAGAGGASTDLHRMPPRCQPLLSVDSKNNIILADRVNLAIFALDYTLKIYTD